MKALKIILIVVASLFILMLAAAIILPRVYKPQLLEAIKEQANESLDATLDFDDLHLSLFRHFPLLTISLEGLSITGKNRFEGVKLIQCQEARLALSIWDLLRKDAPLVIRQFHLHEPDLNILLLEDGTANYDIVIPVEEVIAEAEPGPELEGAIRDYSIRNGRLRYEDREMNLIADLDGLNHRGKGDFAASRFDLDTRTTVDNLYTQYDGITYLNKAKADLMAIIGIDMEAMRFTLKDNQWLINDLLLKGEGMVALPGDDIEVDLKFWAPDNSIRSLWSMVPGAYTQDYAALESSGTFGLNGWIKGIYAEHSFPSFELQVKVADGLIKYPSLPDKIDQIFLEMRIHQPGDVLTQTEIEIPAFSLRTGDQPLKGYFFLKDPMDDPDVKASLQGRLDLAQLSRAFPLEDTELDGRVTADVRMHARMSALDRADYENVDIQGDASFSNVGYRTAGQPNIRIQSGQMAFSPKAVNVTNMDMMAGKSDLRLNAQFDNILAWFHPERTLKGKVDIRSRLLDLDEWSSEPVASSAMPEPGQDDLEIGLPVEQFDLALEAYVDRVQSSGKTVQNLRISGVAGPATIQANEVSGKLKNSDFKIDGKLENFFGWMAGNAVLRGVVNFSANNLVVSDFLDDVSDSASGATEPMNVVPVPPDIQLVAKGKIGRLLYDDLELRNLQGSVSIGNRVLLIEETKADGLGGKLHFEGNYDTRDVARPAFHFKYDMERIDFLQVYRQLPTIGQLAPVMEYLQGRFNTSLVMDGFLGPNMKPLISTIDAAGFLETFNAVLKNFKPIEGLAEKLNIAELKAWEIKNSRNWFEIEDGRVELKDFDYKLKDIDMVIGGYHGLEQDMEYRVRMRIPRKYLDKTGITAQANTGLRWLEAEAAQRGLSIGLGEFVNIMVTIGGRLQKPTYALRILGTEGEGGATLEDQVSQQITGAVDKVRDTLQDIASKRLEEAKEQARKEAEQRLDSLKRLGEAAIDSALIRAQQEAAKKIGDEALKKAEELGGDKAKEEADKIKDKLKKWNPLGGRKE